MSGAPSCEFDAQGWCVQVRRIDSPNADDRPQGMAVELIVIHNISWPPGQFGTGDVERLFTNSLDFAAAENAELKGLKVSAHFLVARDGRITQFVSGDQRAWHAGLSSWRQRERCNDFSIGIELEGTDTAPYEDVQYNVLALLIMALARRYPIRAVLGHEHIAPGRKTDPGKAFAWERIEALVQAQGCAPVDWFREVTVSRSDD
jgi:AmpD protein